jgi:hypothetical protein
MSKVVWLTYVEFVLNIVYDLGYTRGAFGRLGGPWLPSAQQFWSVWLPGLSRVVGSTGSQSTLGLGPGEPHSSAVAGDAGKSRTQQLT